MSRPIVLCYDGSEGARLAIDEAARVLRAEDAIVLNVVESLDAAVFRAAMGPGGKPDPEALSRVPGVEEARRIVDEGCEHARRAGFVAEPLLDVAPSRPSARIIAIAEERDAAAIVVGARGVSSLRSLVLGSVSHEVVQHASGPVLVVHAAAGEQTPQA